MLGILQMTYMAASRTPRAALWLAGLVGGLFLVQIGAFVSDVLAQSVASTSPTPLAPPDTASDVVAATAAEFRVDELGAATYSIPLYGVPGTAGVMPRLALSYSSQGGAGPVGRGWSISGLSAITRCRATTEAGDFVSGGSPAPVNFTATDRYCLDGQRLVPAQAGSAACPAVGGMTAENLRTEVESFQRVCAYTPSGGTTGVAFFTINRKDGSTSWYGDRVVSGTQNLAYNGYVRSTAPGKAAFALYWAQTRFQDSTGNYVDYVYSAPSAGEHLIAEVRYTGKTVLPGQSGSAQSPFAKIQFVYNQRPVAEQGTGYVSGGLVTQKWRLDAVVSCDTMASTCLGDPSLHARYYRLAYAPSVSGSGLQLLDSIQECRDSSMAVCLPATNFDWSTAKFSFSTAETSSTSFALASNHFRGYKQADINGDGRQDLLVLYLAGSGCVNGSWVVSFLGSLNSSSQPILGSATFNCVPAKIYDRGEGAWHLFDYNGDGRDDLFVSGVTGQGWKVHPSNGVHFDMATNLIAGLSPVIPSVDGKNDQVQLADLNGDGLTDVVYPSGSTLRARIMARSGADFAWGSERTVSVDMASLGPQDSRCGYLQGGYTCTRTVAGAPTPKTGFIQMADFNGDAASDLLIQENESGTKQLYGTPGCPIEPLMAASSTESGEVPQGGAKVLSYRYERQKRAGVANNRFVAQALPGECTDTFETVTLHAMAVKSITSTVVTVGSVAQAAGNPHSLSLGDVNGDGLTDLFARSSSTAVWTYRPNTGTGFGAPVSLPASSFEDFARFADVNGDGRTDVLQLVNTGTQKVYQALMALPAGGYSARVPLAGGNAKVCTTSGCEEQEYAPAFGDYDGDGVLDFMRLGMGSSTVSVYFSRALAPHSPRDVVVKVTNGLGAVTQLGYAPLTNAAVYRRESGTRNATNWGRGSPVLDFLAPSYVVASASSSSPQAGNPGAMASLYYRYAGAKVQAGGRGFLGFEEIVTIDPNESGGFVTTQTLYEQGFPYTGVPLRTTRRAGTGSYGISTCLTQPVTDACFDVPGAVFPAPAGSWFSDSSQAWEADTDVAGTLVTAFSPTVQAPVHVRPAASEELLRDPFTGAQTSGVFTDFTYGAYGNTTSTQVDTITGSSTLMSSVITANTYTDTPSAWLLGRLTSSTVTHRRPNRTDVVRTSTFTYAPTTGLLDSETSGAGLDASQVLRKQYLLDQYGNRTRVRICANPATATACNAAVPLAPADAKTVLRQARTVYDSRGRYPLVSYELFSDGSAPVERPTQTVESRDMFGQVTSARDLNYVVTLAGSGTFGRPYYTWTQTVAGSTLPGTTGLESLITYRWCGSGGVDCPAGARFRQQVERTAAPTEWTYFDVLGRPVMKSVESFNANVSGKDATAVCTRYNVASKPIAVSNPFFLAGTTTSGPAGTAGACDASARKWTTTTYDVLGRPVLVTKPNVGGTSSVSMAYSSMATTIEDERGNQTIQRRNGKGELTSVTDANGLVAQYVYYADGSLYYIRRNAGRGIVQNVFYYDTMGRKVRQSDPDSGITEFEYNALGELLVQEDAGGNRVENELDMRGRTWRRTTRLPDGNIESQSTFEFDTGPYGVGRLASEVITGQYAAWAGQANTELGFGRAYAYDSLGRPTGTTTSIDGANYASAVVYNDLGQVWKAKDASGRWTMNQYSARGHLLAVCPTTAASTTTGCPGSTIPTDPTMRTSLRVLETDAWGQVVREQRGQTAAMEVTRDFWDETGRPASICAGNQASCNLAEQGYAWDAAGNLSARQQDGNMESYLYDSLNRLVRATLSMQGGVTANTITQRFEYDALGNTCYRYTLGYATRVYTYVGRSGCGLGGAMNSAHGSGGTGGYGAHQASDLVSGTNHLFHYYDARGNQTQRDSTAAASDRTVHYSADGKLYEATSGTGNRVRFWYGSDGQRYKRDDSGKKTLYIGNVEVVVESGAATTTKRMVAGVVLQTIVGSTATSHYLFHDQLGSIVRIADSNGAVVNSLDFQAFGGRRNPDSESSSGVTAPTLTTRGFTGHEHVDDMNLVHMNGRVYDPYMGRFLQPDPMIQAPDNAQSWNAYTYAFNNPLAYTDPTGLFSWRQVLGIAIAVIGSIVTMGMDGGFWAQLGMAMAFGAASGYVATGTWRGAVTGAFTAGLTFGVGWAAHVYQWGEAARVIAQSMSGGVIEMLQGGNFGNGFVAAGLTAAAMPHVGKINSNVGRTTVGAIVGGTISKATGGKFANGAISGAIQAAIAGRGTARDGEAADERPNLAKADAAISEAHTALEERGLLEKIYSGDDAFREAIEDWGSVIGPIARRYDVEMSALIYDLGGSYVLAGPHSSGYRTLVMPREGPRLNPSLQGRQAGFVHTHPDSPRLSTGDMGMAYDMSRSSTVTTYAVAVVNGTPTSVWSSATRREVPWADF